MYTEINLTLHHVDKAPDLCAMRSVKQSEKFNFKLRDLVT